MHIGNTEECISVFTNSNIQQYRKPVLVNFSMRSSATAEIAHISGRYAIRYSWSLTQVPIESPYETSY